MDTPVEHDMSGQHWVLDKRVPLAIIIALLAQTGAGVWWAATLQAQVAASDRDHDRRLERIERARENDVGLLSRMATLEAQMSDVRSTVLRIDDRTRLLAKVPQ